MAEDSEYHVEGEVFYHVFFSIDRFKIGTIVKSPFPKRGLLGDDILEEARPCHFPQRSKILFVGLEDDAELWIRLKSKLPPNTKIQYNIAKLSLNGELYWFDKDIVNQALPYNMESLKADELREKLKPYAERYWKSAMTTDKLKKFLREHDNQCGNHLFEGLFVGEAKVLDVKEIEYTR